MDLVTEGRTHPFHAALWSRVNAGLTYPEDLSQQGISGSVTLQLSVDHRGAFTGEVIPIDSDDPLLQALSIATLIHALRDPLPQSLWLSEEGASQEPTPVLFRFDYVATRPGETAPEAPERHFKNLLAFQKTARVDAELTRTLDRWLTRYVPPIFPIPGGFYVDVVRLIRLIRSGVTDEPDFYRQREERVERARERWLSVIHALPSASDKRDRGSLRPPR